MIADLQQDSKRWRQEQRQTGNQGSSSPLASSRSGSTVPDSLIEYAGSATQHNAAVGRTNTTRERNSPSVEGPYGLPPTRERSHAERAPADRNPVNRQPAGAMDTRMDIDTPVVPQHRGYSSNDRQYSQNQYGQPENRSFMPQDNRTMYPSDPTIPSGYGARPPVSSAYDQSLRYAPVGYAPESGPANFGRPGEYPPSQYDPVTGPSRANNQYMQGGYGQPQPQPQGRDPRDPRDPRYAPAEFGDPRYASYPSPALTVSSTIRDTVVSPPQQQRFANTARSASMTFAD